MKRVDIIAGARPNFVKIAPIIKAFEKKKLTDGSKLSYRLVHTGQHFDEIMSGSFFSQLGIPKPDINFNVGGGTQAETVGAIMKAYEDLLLREKSDLCLVVGDVNSTLACAITAQKLGVRVAHVEAGIRSGDWSMPEEINRILTDSISNYFFTTSVYANENLRQMGVNEKNIYFVGNTMIDTLFANIDNLTPPEFMLNKKDYDYFTLTLHRPSNVDNIENLQRLLNIISESTQGLEVIFPVHPRTLRSLGSGETHPKNIKFVEPLPYLEFIYLVKGSKAVITDSGGITEEATVLGVPCLTLRDSTERPETITYGTNELIGPNPKNMRNLLEKVFDNDWKKGIIPNLWDGKASERIVNILENVI